MTPDHDYKAMALSLIEKARTIHIKGEWESVETRTPDDLNDIKAVQIKGSNGGEVIVEIWNPEDDDVLNLDFIAAADPATVTALAERVLFLEKALEQACLNIRTDGLIVDWTDNVFACGVVRQLTDYLRQKEGGGL